MKKLKEILNQIKKKFKRAGLAYLGIIVIGTFAMVGALILFTPKSVSKVASPHEQISTYEIVHTQTLTGKLELLWDTPYYTTTPASLVSDSPFTITLALDVKLIDASHTEYLYDIPFTQTISQTSALDINADGFIDKKDLEILKENYGAQTTDLNGDGIVDIFDVVMIARGLDEPGIGLFSTINYTISVPSTINRQTEEWIRPYWIVTSTNSVYLESTGTVFTSSLVTPIWYWLNWANRLEPPDSEGFYQNRIVQLDWAYRYYLPVIMKSAN